MSVQQKTMKLKWAQLETFFTLVWVNFIILWNKIFQNDLWRVEIRFSSFLMMISHRLVNHQNPQIAMNCIRQSLSDLGSDVTLLCQVGEIGKTEIIWVSIFRIGKFRSGNKFEVLFCEWQKSLNKFIEGEREKTREI